jgi:hypothetical protein
VSSIYWKAADSSTWSGIIDFGRAAYTINARHVNVNDYIWVEASNSDLSVEATKRRFFLSQGFEIGSGDIHLFSMCRV